jgi:conflict system STAND superfamily ATPase
MSNSLLQAGLIPAIRDGKLAGLSTWHIVLFTPGAEPVAELAAKLADAEEASPDQGGFTHELPTNDGLINYHTDRPTVADR